MDKKKIVAVISSLVLFLSANTLLRAEEKKFSIGLGAGLAGSTSGINRYIRVDSFNPIPYMADVFVLDRKTELKDHFNLNFQRNFSSRFSVQAEIGHYRASSVVIMRIRSRDINFPDVNEPLDLSWSFTSLFFNAIYRARKSQKKITPFGFIGVGFFSVRKKEDHGRYFMIESRSTLDIGLKGGAGLSYYLPKILPLCFELRAFILILGSIGGGYYSQYIWEGGGSGPVVEGYNYIWGIDLGINYRF
ncbi:MAG: outer membrane beta-barrel protein [Candidatus Aminicenantes bacterium]|nr:outer membrane beta-barrel protein [Candidatus Aminicenantes bacterium]